MKQRWGVIGLVAVISFLSGGWLLQRGVAAGGNVYQQARLFDDVLSHVHSYYVDSIGETDLYDKATNGMLEQLKEYPGVVEASVIYGETDIVARLEARDQDELDELIINQIQGLPAVESTRTFIVVGRLHWRR